MPIDDSTLEFWVPDTHSSPRTSERVENRKLVQIHGSRKLESMTTVEPEGLASCDRDQPKDAVVQHANAQRARGLDRVLSVVREA